jgi:hypothetical protein
VRGKRVATCLTHSFCLTLLLLLLPHTPSTSSATHTPSEANAMGQNHTRIRPDPRLRNRPAGPLQDNEPVTVQNANPVGPLQDNESVAVQNANPAGNEQAEPHSGSPSRTTIQNASGEQAQTKPVYILYSIHDRIDLYRGIRLPRMPSFLEDSSSETEAQEGVAPTPITHRYVSEYRFKAQRGIWKVIYIDQADHPEGSTPCDDPENQAWLCTAGNGSHLWGQVINPSERKDCGVCRSDRDTRGGNFRHKRMPYSFDDPQVFYVNREEEKGDQWLPGTMPDPETLLRIKRSYMYPLHCARELYWQLVAANIPKNTALKHVRRPFEMVHNNFKYSPHYRALLKDGPSSESSESSEEDRDPNVGNSNRVSLVRRDPNTEENADQEPLGDELDDPDVRDSDDELDTDGGPDPEVMGRHLGNIN